MEKHNVDALAEILLADLTQGSEVGGRQVNGRIIRVLFSPRLANSTHVVAGMSAVPAGVATPVHSHEAEELALVLAGSGTILLGDEPISVSSGDLVPTPSGIAHQTIAGQDEALVVLWIYAPPGSEDRWFADVVVEEEGS